MPYGIFTNKIKDIPALPFWIVFKDGNRWEAPYNPNDLPSTHPTLDLEFFTDPLVLQEELHKRIERKDSFRCFKVTSEATVEVTIKVDV